MPIVKVKTPFPYSHNGYQVVQYEVGEQELSDDCAALAASQGWLEGSDQKAIPAAPENRDAAKLRGTKRR